MKRDSRLLCIFMLVLFLPACANMKRLTQPQVTTTVEVVNTTSYPELPDIQMPLEPALIAWEYDVPRDMSKFEPKNEACGKTAETARDEAWDAKCGVNPVVHDSNVLYGFDQRNWNILLSNFARLREYIIQLKARIDLANESRQEWRRKAEAERNKAAASGVGTPAPPATPAPAPAVSAPPAAPASQPAPATEPPR